MPRIIPEPRYFSIPSMELGAEVFRNRALNCWPWARSLIHSPDAVIHSPAEMMAAWPTTVTRSRCPRAFALRTQKPFSALWKVTRSTRPARTSCVDDSGVGFMCALRSPVLSSRATPRMPRRRSTAQSGPHWLNGAYWRCRHACQVEVHDLGAPVHETDFDDDARGSPGKRLPANKLGVGCALARFVHVSVIGVTASDPLRFRKPD